MNSVDESATARDAPVSYRENLASAIGAVAADIASGMSPGEVAALKRLKPSEVGCPAFWKALASHFEPRGLLPDNAEARLQAERRLGVVLSAMALLKGLHSPEASLGRALAGANLAEARFLRLLRAQGDVLLDAVRTTATFLAVQAVHVDQVGLAQLVMSDGTASEEDVRRKIARDYYSKIGG